MADSGRCVSEGAGRLADWISVLPVAEAVVRDLESSWLSSQPLDEMCLDVGCGDGLFGKHTFSSAISVGIDLDHKKLRTALGTGAYKSVVVSDVKALPFRSGVFNCVTANGSMEHVPHVEIAMDELARVVRAGGVFALTVPGPCCGGADKLMRGESVPFWERPINPIWGHINLWPPEKWAVTPPGAWALQKTHPYLGLRRYRLCLLFFWLGGPAAYLVRFLFGRRVLLPSLRRIWASYAARWIGEEKQPVDKAHSHAVLLKRLPSI